MRPLMNVRFRMPIGTKRKTGETCPESGVWKVDHPTETTTIPLAERNTFPPYKQKSVTWVLISYA